MLLLGLDLETTGLSWEFDRIIEIGAVVWDTDESRPVAIQSELVNIGEQSLPKIISDLTGIFDKDLAKFGISEKQALLSTINLAEHCDYVVAHNGNSFDKKFLDKALESHGLELSLPWIDTMHDVPYSDGIKTRKLSYLATEHAFLNPYSHRACFDVLTMFKVLENYDINEVVELSKSPTVKVQAVVSYDDRNKAKEAGFRWDSSNRAWVKEMKEVHLQTMKLPFETTPFDN
ncbi:MAG: exonuclease domain-containing protein [Bdellovibrionales bacterium]